MTTLVEHIWLLADAPSQTDFQCCSIFTKKMSSDKMKINIWQQSSEVQRLLVNVCGNNKPINYNCLLLIQIVQMRCFIFFFFNWRQEHLRRPFPRWELQAEALRRWLAQHGKRWKRHQRLSVLYHHSSDSVAGRQTCRLWKNSGGNGECLSMKYNWRIKTASCWWLNNTSKVGFSCYPNTICYV